MERRISTPSGFAQLMASILELLGGENKAWKLLTQIGSDLSITNCRPVEVKRYKGFVFNIKFLNGNKGFAGNRGRVVLVF